MYRRIFIVESFSLRPCCLRLVSRRERAREHENDRASGSRASLIRIRHTRYYVDDNGPRINIHAGDAHKCYRCIVLLVYYMHDAATYASTILEDLQRASGILDSTSTIGTIDRAVGNGIPVSLSRSLYR